MDMSRSVRSPCASPPARERPRRDAERAGDHAQRFDDAEDAGGGDRADADEAHVAAEDLRRVHLPDRDRGRDRRPRGTGCRS